MEKIKITDVSKLVFKPSFLTAVKITVFVQGLGKHYPITRDQIISCISRGVHTDKINAWFTAESIKAASKSTKPESKKDKKDES